MALGGGPEELNSKNHLKYLEQDIKGETEITIIRIRSYLFGVWGYTWGCSSTLQVHCWVSIVNIVPGIKPRVSTWKSCTLSLLNISQDQKNVHLTLTFMIILKENGLLMPIRRHTLEK